MGLGVRAQSLGVCRMEERVQTQQRWLVFSIQACLVDALRPGPRPSTGTLSTE